MIVVSRLLPFVSPYLVSLIFVHYHLSHCPHKLISQFRSHFPRSSLQTLLKLLKLLIAHSMGHVQIRSHAGSIRRGRHRTLGQQHRIVPQSLVRLPHRFHYFGPIRNDRISRLFGFSSAMNASYRGFEKKINRAVAVSADDQMRGLRWNQLRLGTRIRRRGS